MRTVCVAYVVNVYATVDLDAGEVTRVFEAVEGIRLDEWATITDSYDEGAVDPATLTGAEATLAIAIAESKVWPAWES